MSEEATETQASLDAKEQVKPEVEPASNDLESPQVIDTNASTENINVPVVGVSAEILEESEVDSDELVETQSAESNIELPAGEEAKLESSNLGSDDLFAKYELLQKEIDSLNSEIQETDDDLIDKQEKLEKLISVQEELHVWVEKHRRSFAWKFSEQLRLAKKALDADESTIREFASTESDLEFGFGEKTRKWFMRRFMLNFLITWGIVGLVLYLHKYAENISDSIARNVSNQGWNQFLTSVVQNTIGPNYGRFIFYVFLISFVHFCGLLFEYSRKNNDYAEHVAVESSKTLAMESGIHKVRESKEIIDSLHPQVNQVISILSLGLHNPWKVSEEAMFFKGSVPDATALPASIDISIPTISSTSPEYEELIAKTMNKIQIPGWRAAAFENALQVLSNANGFGHNGMALRELDEDQRRSGKRQMLLNIENVRDYLAAIGDKLVENLAAEVQETVLPTVQPKVVSLKPDPLGDLELSGSLIKNDTDLMTAWESKLSEIGGTAAPWSSETFSNSGSASKKHESLESVFMASSRVKDMAESSVESHADIEPGSRPFEVAIRVDFSGWCKPYEVGIFEDYQPTQEQLARWNKTVIKDETEPETNEPEAPFGGLI